MSFDELCAQLTRDLFAIAKFLSNNVSFHSFEYAYIILGFSNIYKVQYKQTHEATNVTFILVLF